MGSSTPDNLMKVWSAVIIDKRIKEFDIAMMRQLNENGLVVLKTRFMLVEDEAYSIMCAHIARVEEIARLEKIAHPEKIGDDLWSFITLTTSTSSIGPTAFFWQGLMYIYSGETRDFFRVITPSMAGTRSDRLKAERRTYIAYSNLKTKQNNH